MRKEDIEECLVEAKELLLSIPSYKKTPKAKVKSFFEHLRSCLDYSAHDISSKLSGPSKDKVYFPYGGDLKSFEKSINDKYRLPQLKSELPEVYQLLINLHEFGPEKSWLKIFCDLTNHTKHNGAIDIRHDKELVKSISVNAGRMELLQAKGENFNVHFSNNIVNGKLLDDFKIEKGEITVIKEGEISINFRITKDKKILVGEDRLDLLPFLNKCINNIEEFVELLYKKLESI